MNQALLQFEFDIGHYNGTMSMQIFDGASMIADYKSFDSTIHTFTHTCQWPTNIKIVLGNKNMSCDTQIDQDGKILADKHVRLKKLVVDRVEATAEFIKTITLETIDDQKIPALYWGFSGEVNINLDQTDSFVWHLKQKITKQKLAVVESKRM
jgi:hypothetical protein